MIHDSVPLQTFPNIPLAFFTCVAVPCHARSRTWLSLCVDGALQPPPALTPTAFLFFSFFFVTRREASSTQRRFQVTRGFLSPARAFIYAGPLLEPRPSEKILAYRTELRTEIALPHLAPR